MNRTSIVFIFIVAIINICESAVLLYNTENTGNTEEVDCIYYTESSTVKYCGRRGTRVYVSTNIDNCLNGKRWSFSELLSNETSPWDVLSWSSSVEKADDYARVEMCGTSPGPAGPGPGPKFNFLRDRDWDRDQIKITGTGTGTKSKSKTI